jgi:hypothetical protein
MEMRNERYTELLRDRGVAEYSSEENRCFRQESSGALWPLYCFAQSSASRLPRAVERGLVADPSVFCYSPIALRASRSPALHHPGSGRGLDCRRSYDARSPVPISSRT